MNGPEIRLIGCAVTASSSSSAGPSRSLDEVEVSSIRPRVILQDAGDDSCAKPLGHRARRAQQKSSHSIQTCEWSKDALRMLGEKALKDVREFERLWSYLLRSRTDSKCIIAAKNAIEALNLVGYSFSGKDLSGVNIPGANLSYGIFQRTNFSGANLEGVNFHCAHLAEVSFVGANLRNIDFGQFNLIDFDMTPSGKRFQVCNSSSLDIHKDEASNQTVVAVRDHHLLGTNKIRLWSLNEPREPFIRVDTSWSRGLLAFTQDGEKLIFDINHELCIWHVKNYLIVNKIVPVYISKQSIVDEFSEELLENLIYLECLKLPLDHPDYVLLDYEKAFTHILRRGNVILSFSSSKVFTFLRERTLLDHCSVSRNCSPQLMACVNLAGDINIWDLNETRLVDIIIGEKAIGKPYFISDENYLIIPNRRFIKLFERTTRKSIRLWSSPDPDYYSSAMSFDRKWLAATSSEGVVVWSYDSEQPYKIIEFLGLSSSSSIVFSRNSQSLAISNGQEILIWDIRDWTVRHHLGGFKYPVRALEFIMEDKAIVSISEGGKTIGIGEPPKVTKLSQDVPKQSKRHAFPIQSLQTTSNGRWLLTHSQDALTIWDAPSGQFIYQLKEKYDCFVVSRDSKYVLLKSGNRVNLWDIETKTEVLVINRESGIQGVGFIATGSLLIIGAETLQIFDFESQKFNYVLEGEVRNLTCYAFSQDCRWLAMGLKEGILGAWDSESGNYYSTRIASQSTITSIRFAGNTVVFISNGWASLWDPVTGVVNKLDGYNNAWGIPGSPRHFLLQKHYEWYIYSTETSSYCLIEFNAGFDNKLKQKFNSSESAKIVSLQDRWGKIITWNKNREAFLYGYVRRRISCHSNEYLSPCLPISTFGFHYAQSTLALGLENGMIEIWNPIKTQLLNVLFGNNVKITGLDFSEDGLRLFSFTEGGGIQCWDFSPDWKTAKLRWQAGTHALVLHRINTYRATLDDFEDLSLLPLKNSRVDATLGLVKRLMKEKNYLGRPHVLRSENENEYFINIDIKRQNVKLAATLIHHKILRKINNQVFLQGLMDNIGDLKELVPSSFRYIVNAIALVARHISERTTVDPAAFAILAVTLSNLLPNEPLTYFSIVLCDLVPEKPIFLEDFLDHQCRAVIKRLFTMLSEEALSEIHYEVYNKVAEIFYIEENTMNAIECYNRSLRANPEQGIILYQRGLLLLSQGCKEEALKNFKLAQNIGGPYLPDLTAKLEELEVKLDIEQGVL